MKVPISNDGQSVIFVGGRMIPPGEVVLFEEHELPAEYRAPAEPSAEVPPEDPLAVILDMKVADVVNGLGALDDQDLAKLGELEAAGKARKGVLEAVAEEQLARAEAKVGGEQ